MYKVNWILTSKYLSQTKLQFQASCLNSYVVGKVRNALNATKISHNKKRGTKWINNQSAIKNQHMAVLIGLLSNQITILITLF